MRHSKLQIAVLSLYKDFLRAAKSQPAEIREEIRKSFREGARSYSTTDFFLIEHQLVRAHRQLQQLQSASITGYQRVTIRRGDIKKADKENNK
jgi:hypothetical protein